MPDPLLYSKAMAAAAGVSALCLLALAAKGRKGNAAWLRFASIAAIISGLVAGYYVLALRLHWPPETGLDRLLMILLPAAIVIELVAGFERLPRWLAWVLRGGLAAVSARILLHGSVYLGSGSQHGSLLNVAAVLIVSAALLLLVWGLLGSLARRSPGVSIPLALALTTQCAGATIMLAGYLAGGAAALPLAAALGAVAMVLGRVRPEADAQAAIGVGVVGLFGLVFIGRFFGALSTPCAVTLLLAPTLCWVTEIPLLKGRGPWTIGATRLAVVAIPLVVVLALAKRHFDQKFAPLLGEKRSGSQSSASAEITLGRPATGVGLLRIDFAQVSLVDLDSPAGVFRPQ